MTEEPEAQLRVAILVASDRAASGERPDATGPRLEEFLRVGARHVARSPGDRHPGPQGLGALPVQVVEILVVPDERQQIADALRQLSDRADVVLTAGGTGLAARDVTPEATASVIERQAPGIAEAMRAAGLRTTPHAMLSRGIAGVRGRSLIINLPGSPRGAVESLAAVWPAVPHAIAIITGAATDRSHT